MDQAARAAFERLLKVAQGDTGQSRRAANFVLAWWNDEVHGGFDLADLFAVDRAIANDMASVFAFVADSPEGIYPTAYRAEIEKIIRLWRPGGGAQAIGSDAA